MTSAAESVLCTPTRDLPRAWLPEAGAVVISAEEFRSALRRLPNSWLPRAQAECDEGFKQWIPYVLLCDPGGRLAAYPRQGSETRLHGCWSLGIGGHVNPGDAGAGGDAAADVYELLWSGLRRELAEEYPACVPGQTRFLGLIHEALSAVGRVHIGAVFLHETDACDRAPGPELAGLLWLERSQVGSAQWPLDRFELWSQLALGLMPGSRVL